MISDASVICFTLFVHVRSSLNIFVVWFCCRFDLLFQGRAKSETQLEILEYEEEMGHPFPVKNKTRLITTFSARIFGYKMLTREKIHMASKKPLIEREHHFPNLNLNFLVQNANFPGCNHRSFHGIFFSWIVASDRLPETQLFKTQVVFLSSSLSLPGVEGKSIWMLVMKVNHSQP